jgi:hypothetical protein
VIPWAPNRGEKSQITNRAAARLREEEEEERDEEEREREPGGSWREVTPKELV